MAKDLMAGIIKLTKMSLKEVVQDGQRVLTTAQLAESYGTVSERISKNFSENKSRYTKGKHFIVLQGLELQEFKNNFLKSELVGKNANTLYLWTEKGAWLHAKSLNTDQAWDAYEMLVDEYYKVKENALDLSQLSPELQMFNQIFKVTAEFQIEQKEQAKRLSEMEKEQQVIKGQQENIKDILSLNPTEWRKKVNNIINKIAKDRGGHNQNYQEIRNESYQILEDRARCNLSTRLTNKRKNMTFNGISKSKIESVNKLEVISEDTRLTEIYLAIVKELAIKHDMEVLV